MFKISRKKGDANFLCHFLLTGFGRSFELGITTDEVERVKREAIKLLALAQLPKTAFASRGQKPSRKVKEVPVA